MQFGAIKTRWPSWVNRLYLSLGVPGSRLSFSAKASFKNFIGVAAYDDSNRCSALPLPLSMQIQTIDRCNALCRMCPYSHQRKTGPPRRMSEELFRRILYDLGTKRRVTHAVALMLQNEPLVDQHLAERYREVRTILNRRGMGLVTNASLLTPDRADELVEAGLRRVTVSIDAATESTYRRIRRGLNFRKVTENVLSLMERHPEVMVTVRFLQQRSNLGEDVAFKNFWKKHGAQVSIKRVLNRAGGLAGYETIKRIRPRDSRRTYERILHRIYPFCINPFTAMTVLADGRVVICCHDWQQKVIVGDLNRQSVAEVWHSGLLNHYRHLLYTGQSRRIPTCDRCTFSQGFWSEASF